MFFTCSCRKNHKDCTQYVRSPVTLFEIRQSGKFISDSTILSEIKISYSQNNTTKYLSDLTVSDTIMTGTVVNRVITSTSISSVSADGNTKIFYIEYPENRNVDTLYLDYSTPSNKTNCHYIFGSIMFNNQIPDINKSLPLPTPNAFVYILDIQ